jgi:ribosomal protein S12 methylthiotransferase
MFRRKKDAEELSCGFEGKEFKVIIDRKEGDYYIGRTQFDSPEVDPEVLIKADDEYLKIGEFYKVKITAADDFDLYASIL